MTLVNILNFIGLLIIFKSAFLAIWYVKEKLL